MKLPSKMFLFNIICKLRRLKISKMASLLLTYEKQYGSLTSEITHKLGTLLSLRDDEYKQECSNTERLFDEAKELLEQMALEISDLPAGVKQKYKHRFDSYKKELEKLEKEFKRPRYSTDEMMREDLLGGDDRAHLLSNTERLERSSGKLDDGYRIAVETEQIGATILEDLHHQKETLTKGRDRLRATNENLGKSSRILSGMLLRVVQNRIIIVIIILVMIIIVGVTVYIVSKKKSQS